jgi:hypothetical protein
MWSREIALLFARLLFFEDHLCLFVCNCVGVYLNSLSLTAIPQCGAQLIQQFALTCVCDSSSSPFLLFKEVKERLQQTVSISTASVYTALLPLSIHTHSPSLLLLTDNHLCAGAAAGCGRGDCHRDPPAPLAAFLPGQVLGCSPGLQRLLQALRKMMLLLLFLFHLTPPLSLSLSLFSLSLYLFFFFEGGKDDKE